MKNLKSLLKTEQIIDVPYYDDALDGFVVTFSYVSRDMLKDIRLNSEVTKFNRSTRQPEQSIDEDLFQKLYCQAAIKGWSGLKMKYLASLVLIELGAEGEDEELDYTQENAVDLISNSIQFDTFVTEVMKDFNFFSKTSLKRTLTA